MLFRSKVRHVCSDNNSGDGFELDPATSCVEVLNSSARGNTGEGFNVDGGDNLIKSNFACKNSGCGFLNVDQPAEDSVCAMINFFFNNVARGNATNYSNIATPSLEENADKFTGYWANIDLVASCMPCATC